METNVMTHEEFSKLNLEPHSEEDPKYTNMSLEDHLYYIREMYKKFEENIHAKDIIKSYGTTQKKVRHQNNRKKNKRKNNENK